MLNITEEQKKQFLEKLEELKNLEICLEFNLLFRTDNYQHLSNELLIEEITKRYKELFKLRSEINPFYNFERLA